MPAPMRIVALGASNLTRGLHPLVCAARAAWGSEVEILAALGHGRSYGARSRFLFRTLPGILCCGLWRALGDAVAMPTRALLTDVGNDLLYGFSADQTLAWVEECVRRLRERTSDVTLTGLPLAGIRRLSPAKYMVFRSLLVPRCRLSLREATVRAEQVEAGLRALAARHRLRFLPLEPGWYGFDPIHIRPTAWATAWQEILCGGPLGVGKARPWEAVRLHLLAPERQWLFGVEQHRSQHDPELPGGGRLRLF